jgi:hypothetical protein
MHLKWNCFLVLCQTENSCPPQKCLSHSFFLSAVSLAAAADAPAAAAAAERHFIFALPVVIVIAAIYGPAATFGTMESGQTCRRRFNGQ